MRILTFWGAIIVGMVMGFIIDWLMPTRPHPVVWGVAFGIGFVMMIASEVWRGS